MTVSLPLLIIGTFLSAVISAVAGLGGGVLLFAILSASMGVKLAIPIHGALQVISNLSRIVVYRQHIDWPVVTRFVILVIPGAWLGGRVFASLNEQILSLIIGVAILGSVFLPPPKKKDKIDLKWFSLFGGISSFLSMIVGAVGPLLAPAFYRAGLSKERLVATKAVCQGTVQLAKVIIFSTTLSFSYAEYWQILLLLTGVIVLGTWAGKKVLGKMPDRHFDWFLKAVLLIAGGKIIWDACASFGWS